MPEGYMLSRDEQVAEFTVRVRCESYCTPDLLEDERLSQAQQAGPVILRRGRPPKFTQNCCSYPSENLGRKIPTQHLIFQDKCVSSHRLLSGAGAFVTRTANL